MGKIAVVTGASGGIGRAVCARLLADGYVVYAQYRSNPDKCIPGSVPVFGDFSDRNGVGAFAAQIILATKKIDLLVNNAGISMQKLFTDCTDEETERAVFCDLTSVMLLTRQLSPLLRNATSASVVNLSSVWGVYGGSCEVAYSAAKGGIIAFTKALSKEWGRSNIRVNCVAPGLIDTAMNANLSEFDKKSFAEGTALGRIGEPEEIASAVAFLGSDAASFITGQVISADGGM